MLGVALVPALFACDSTTGPEAGDRVMGILEWQWDGLGNAGTSSTASFATQANGDGNPTVISAPDTVEAGVPFSATITTIGPSACWREAGAAVESGARLAVVVPYDFTAENQNTLCASVMVELPRRVEIQFTATGEATLRAAGRRVVNGEFGGSTAVETLHTCANCRIHEYVSPFEGHRRCLEQVQAQAFEPSGKMRRRERDDPGRPCRRRNTL